MILFPSFTNNFPIVSPFRSGNLTSPSLTSLLYSFTLSPFFRIIVTSSPTLTSIFSGSALSIFISPTTSPAFFIVVTS